MYGESGDPAMARQRSIEQLTLRDMFTEAERLTRELTEHLEQGFNPKVSELLQLVRPTPSGAPASNVEDITVRNHVADVLDSENFTARLYKTLDVYLEGINRSASRIVGEEE